MPPPNLQVTCICQFCQIPFKVKRSKIAIGHGKYCSIKCRAKGVDQREPLAVKLMRYVQVGNENECWPFVGTTDAKGYGMVQYDGSMRGAHRASYIVHKGQIPEGMLIMHSCDNPPCCNPKHLSLGTKKSNYDDMINKGRSKKLSGENHPHSKWTVAQILEMRSLKDKGYSTRQICEIYKMSFANANKIFNRKLWKHI
jgi:hypothetical protein